MYSVDIRLYIQAFGTVWNYSIPLNVSAGQFVGIQPGESKGLRSSPRSHADLGTERTPNAQKRPLAAGAIYVKLLLYRVFATLVFRAPLQTTTIGSTFACEALREASGLATRIL